MAGRGSRFAKEGYDLPKPLIPVHGKEMIRVVINNIKPKQEHRFIFLCLKDHAVKYQIDKKLKIWVPDCQIILIENVTEGAACTVLLAKDLINNNDGLMIANSDQWVDFDINDYLHAMEKDSFDGYIMTMWADHPKWSYVGFDSKGEINRVVEKEVVSNEATVGIYNFARGSDYVNAAENMIKKNLRVNNEFYVAPTYNEIISAGSKVGYYNIGKEYDGMYGMGIPSDLQKFLNTEICKKATN
jgi:NDP-sugar pyrophosphorylase family protein